MGTPFQLDMILKVCLFHHLDANDVWINYSIILSGNCMDYDAVWKTVSLQMMDTKKNLLCARWITFLVVQTNFFTATEER